MSSINSQKSKKKDKIINNSNDKDSKKRKANSVDNKINSYDSGNFNSNYYDNFYNDFYSSFQNSAKRNKSFEHYSNLPSIKGLSSIYGSVSANAIIVDINTAFLTKKRKLIYIIIFYILL